MQIQFFETSGGSGLSFFRNGGGDKSSQPSLGLKMEKGSSGHGLYKLNMFGQGAAPALVFSKVCVGAILLAQTLDTRRESGVIAMG